MTIYIVWHHICGGYELEAIFTTKQKAEDHIFQMQSRKKWVKIKGLEIEEREID